MLNLRVFGALNTNQTLVFRFEASIQIYMSAFTTKMSSFIKIHYEFSMPRIKKRFNYIHMLSDTTNQI